MRWESSIRKQVEDLEGELVGPGVAGAVAVAAGMISSTALTLLVVPAFYLVLDDVIRWVGARARRALHRAPAASAS